jgi:ethanolamine permease
MMGYSRQVYALARGGYLPPFLAYLHPRRRTPIWAVVVPGILGLGVVLTGKTALAIGISTLGATILYITSMVSLLVLRRREPELARPFRAPGYPFLPVAALVLAAVCLTAIVASEPILGAVALAGMSAFLIYYLAVARERVRSTRDEIPTL